MIFSDTAMCGIMAQVLKLCVAEKSVLELSVLYFRYKKEPDPNLECAPKQVWLSCVWPMITQTIWMHSFLF